MNLDTIASVKQQLLDGISKGYWTLENLDHPSPGWVTNTFVDKRTFPDSYQGIRHRNLLRDDAVQPERVQLTDPKDLPPMAHGVTPPQQDGPLTTDEDWF